MKLADVIEEVAVKSVTGSLDLEVAQVCYDSRTVAPGGVFCALRGAVSDGNKHIGDAVDRGAVAVVSEQRWRAQHPVAWLEVADAREAMGRIAAALAGHPSRTMKVVGVTGTNGKTTTAFLVHHLFKSAMHRAGLIGTVRYAAGDDEFEAPRTTPESPDLQEMLVRMRDAACRGVAMEVSSHGLAQRRVAAVSFDAGVFTNLSQDHLDYHGSMESYFEAKRLLFESMDADSAKRGTAVVNIDDQYGSRLAKTKFERLQRLSFGRSARADYRIENVRSDFHGTRFKLSVKGRQLLVQIPLIGVFNAYNATAALAAASASGMNLREAVAHIAGAPQVPGRLESVSGRQINYRVYVDYAHTPDALANVLETLRALEPRRLLTVFGCGGDRDRAKRPVMAAAAEAGSDYCILTSDNPRTEDPEKIIDDARAGFRGSFFESVTDRRDAIRRAIDLAGERDIVLIAGKGHETYQEIEGVRHPFDDRRVAEGFINRKAEESDA